MRIECDARTLAADIGWLAAFLPSRPAVPVVAGIRLDAGGDSLNATVFDYDTCAATATAAGVAQPGSVLVSGRMLAAAAAQLPEGHAVLEADGRHVTLACGAARFRLITMPLEDYPDAPAAPEPLGQVDGAALAQAVARTQVACATEQHTPQLTGIQLNLGESGLRVVTTDTYRIAEQALDFAPVVDDPGDVSMLAPRRTLAAAVKAMAGPVQIGASYENGAPAGLGISSPTRSLTTRLLDDAKYPPVGRYLDTTPEGRPVVCATARLLEAVRRVASVAEANTPVLLEISAEEIRVDAGSGEEARGADTVPCTSEFEGRVAFAAGFLVDALTQTPGETVRLLTPGGVKPVLLSPDEDAPAYRHLVVPRRLEGYTQAAA